jgi:hypothetical protein
VLYDIGERESGTGRLEEAVAAYREALKEYTRERVPLYWAMTKTAFGDVSRDIAERTHQPPCEAVEAHYRVAVSETPYAAEARTRLKMDLGSTIPPIPASCPNIAPTIWQDIREVLASLAGSEEKKGVR